MRERVLYVAPLNPFMPGGGSQATRAYMDATLEIFGRNKVDVMVNKGVLVPDKYKGINFIFVPQRPKLLSYVLFSFGVLGRFAVYVARYLNSHREQYQCCIINGSLESGWCFKHVEDSGVEKVTIHHNQEVKYCMDTKNILTLRGKWPYMVLQAEKIAYKYSDYNLFLTQYDMDCMKKEYGYTKAKNRLIGTFDYKDARVIRPRKEGKDFHIVASGTMSHYQTIHGIMDFYNRYYSIARKLIPNLKVLLTGRNPSIEIRRLEESKNDITIVPNPENIMDQVQRGQFYLCPTDIGSGLKLRAMDGLKSGLPVLVHEVSARGYDYYYDKPYYRIYTDESSFERGLKEILSFLKHTPDSEIIINHDYYDYFGFSKGTERLKTALGGGKNGVKHLIIVRLHTYCLKAA